MIRNFVAAVSAAVTAAGCVLVGAAAPATASSAAVGATGRYTAVASTRILDTRTGTGGAKGRLAARGSVTVALPPAVPAGANAVVVNLTATNGSAPGDVRVYSGSVRPAVSNVNYVRGTTIANLAFVGLTSSRTITLYNEGGAVDMIVDLAGYVRPGASATGSSEALGGIAALTPGRVLDTRTGLGAGRAKIAGQHAINLRVAGTTGRAVPSDASAVLVNLTALSSAGGFVTAYPTGAARTATSNLNLYAHSIVPGLALVPVGSGGSITLYNGSSQPIDLIADLQGYVAGGAPVTTGAAGALVPQRLLDTRSTGHALTATGSVSVKVIGAGGVPISAVSNVVVTVTALSPTHGGHLAVYPAGTARPGTSNLNYAAQRNVANTVVVPPGTDGLITIANSEGGNGHVDVLVDVTGYVRGADVSVPSTTRSRYLGDLTTNAAQNQTTMAADGCADARLSPSLVLLDVGAQSRHAPLSFASPGVALAQTSVVRLTYAQLRDALDAYLSGFAGCRTAAARIAVGTNSDGNFRDTSASDNPPYPATSRGVDWANQVVDQLTVPAGLSLVGANDMEAGFAGTEADDEAWISAFLGATSIGFVFNGSLDACSDSYDPAKPFVCQPVDNGDGMNSQFTPAQYVRLTYGLAPGRISVLPQIYLSVADQAAQWRNLYLASGKKLTFEGSLTQFGVCGSVTCGFTGAQGWSALEQALSTVVTRPTLPVATDLVAGGTGASARPASRTFFHGA